MRLLRTDLFDTDKFEIKEFNDSQIPPYAILSHRWGEEEVTLQDIDRIDIKEKQGYKKIKGCCKIAKESGFGYVWIDTCCIDKTSSAELSEAINSMYYWYGRADICYAYLDDVQSTNEEGTEEGKISSGTKISTSMWFTRGWTLQELIAPSDVVFFDKKWIKLGNRTEFEELLSEITRIPRNVLSGVDHLELFSVAQRMSWAAERQTTRLEDQAYCLMGIFGVNMPLLYGERENAFLRLQEEILRISDDPTLFAWKFEDGNGLLAPSPAAFLKSHNIIRSNRPSTSSNPPTLSSRGIYLEVPFIGVGHGIGLAILDCQEGDGRGENKLYALYVRDTLLTMRHFTRVRIRELIEVDLETLEKVQYPSRRICIQSGRTTIIRPKKLNHVQCFDDTEIYSNEKLWSLMQIDAKQILNDAATIQSEGFTWLVLTRQDVEMQIKSESFDKEVLYLAIKKCNHKFLEMLFDRGMRLEMSLAGRGGLLRSSIQVGYMPSVKLILDNSQFRVNSASGKWLFGTTELWIAAELGHELVVHGMLTHFTKFPARQLYISLRKAVEKGHEYIVQMLLERGTSTETTDNDRQTLLMIAVMRGYASIVELLLEWGANVHAIDEDGRTALSYANELGDECIAQLIMNSEKSSMKN